MKTKKEKPTFIPYFICSCKDLPGKFLLGYQPRGKPRWVCPPPRARRSSSSAAPWLGPVAFLVGSPGLTPGPLARRVVVLC